MKLLLLLVNISQQGFHHILSPDSTGSPHKLCDCCNELNLEEIFGNIEKFHFILLQYDEFLYIRSK